MALRPYRHLMLQSRRGFYSLLEGHHLTAQGGGGAEFREIREYQPGDPLRHINWRASARSRRPVVNLYQPSRRLDARLVYACGGSMAYGSVRPKHETATELLTLLAGIAEAARDRIETLIYDDTASEWIGTRQERHGSEILYHTLEEHNPLGRRVTPEACIETLMESLPRRSLIYLLGDFLEPWNLEELAARHEVVLLKIRDRGEEHPDLSGSRRLLDPMTGTVTELTLDTAALRRYEKTRRERDRTFEAMLRRFHIPHRTVHTDDDPVEALAAFLREMAG